MVLSVIVEYEVLSDFVGVSVLGSGCFWYDLGKLVIFLYFRY